MPTTRGLLHGWELMKHIRNMQSKGVFYISPWIYEPMRLNPPPMDPRISKTPPKIILPTDALKRKIERYSIHGQALSRNVLPHDMSRRQIDHAAARVKDLMRHDERLTEKDAIKIFDREYEHELLMRKREADMLREDAIKSGEAITVLDGLHMMQMLQDLQKETAVKNELKREIAMKRHAENRKQSRFQTSTEITQEELQSIQIDANVDIGDRLLPLEKYKVNRFDIEKVIPANSMRRVLMSQDIKQIIVYMRKIRVNEYKIPNAQFSTGDDISPFDFLAIYMKAYDVNKPAEGELDLEREQALYSGSKALHTYTELTKRFRIMFEKFKLLAPVEPDYTSIVNKIGLEGNPNGKKVDVLAKVAFPRINFDEIIEQFKEYNFAGFESMKEDQKHIEDFFYSLQLDSVLRDYAAETYDPKLPTFVLEGHLKINHEDDSPELDSDAEEASGDEMENMEGLENDSEDAEQYDSEDRN
jgi:hypothetical protein